MESPCFIILCGKLLCPPLHRGLYTQDTLYYDAPADRVIVLNTTLPLMRETGTLK